MKEIEDRKVAQWSPDVIELDSPDSNESVEAKPAELEEPEVVEKVETDESTESEKVTEPEQKESEVVEEVPVVVETEEIAMEAETTPSVEAPEATALAATVPMDISTASESQPSPAILGQSSTGSLIPSTLECIMQLSYPFDSPEDPTDIEKDLRESLPHQVVAKAQSLTELFQKVDLQLIPLDVITFLDSMLLS